MALPAWRAHAAPLDAIVAALGIAAPLATFWYDTGYAHVVVGDEAEVRALTPDQVALAACGEVVAVVSARGTETDFVSRVFTPYFGIPEDPVTGSAHALMVPYWAEQFGRTELTAYQASARGGYLHCTLDGDRVILRGQCVTVIEGVFTL